MSKIRFLVVVRGAERQVRRPVVALAPRAAVEHAPAPRAALLAAVLAVAWVVHLLLRRLVVRGIERLVRRSSTSWDDALQESKVFERLALVIPVLVIWQGAALITEIPDKLLELIHRLAVSGIVLIATLAIMGFLSSLNVTSIAQRDEHRSIKGYLEIGQILVAVVAGILILAILLDRSPMVFLGGLGAMTAVLLLVFRDTLLRFVASIQFQLYEASHHIASRRRETFAISVGSRHTTVGSEPVN